MNTEITKPKLDKSGKTIFNNIYNSKDPRAYCLAMKKLQYVIPKESSIIFKKIFAQYRKQFSKKKIKILDLGSSYGINSAMLKFKLGLEDFYDLYSTQNTKNCSSKKLSKRDKKTYIKTNSDHEMDFIGFDSSKQALKYAQKCGLLKESIHANLEVNDLKKKHKKNIQNLDFIISTGCIGYITNTTLEKILNTTHPKKPWMVHCVLRIFDLKEIVLMFESYNYDVIIHKNPIKQRRFASHEEKLRILEKLNKMQINTKDLEDSGWMYSWVIIAKTK